MYKIFSINLLLVLSIYSGKTSPVPKSSPDPDPDPKPQPPFGSRSSQQFSMYRPIQLQYNQGPSGPGGPGGGRRDPNGNPLQPVFAYNYNISHPAQQGIGPGGVILPNHGQYSNQFQSQFSGNPQQRAQFVNSQQRQFQNPRGSYHPVIIANPEAITQPELYQQQIYQQQQGPNGNSISAHFLEDRDQEDGGVGFRIGGGLRRRGKGNSIVFDQRTPDQQLLNRASQYQDKIVFANGQQIQNQLSRPDGGQYNGNFPNDQGPVQIQVPYVTPGPPIQVPYVTTPSALKRIMQLQKNPQGGALAGFRSQLGLVNPLSLQQTSLADLNRNAYNLNPAGRAARVQNFVIPYNNPNLQPQLQNVQNLQNAQNLQNVQNLQNLQTPAGTQYLNPQQALENIQNLQNAVANNAFAIQRGLNPYLQSQINLSSPNLTLLRGTAITPENQGRIGQYVFSDPNNPNPNLRTTSNTNPLIASSAQKLFILPPGNLPSNDKNSLNFDETPSEIIITVVDDDPTGQNGDKGNILTNFSLFLMPSTYKKCVEGYRKAHDGKCRLIIKLRSHKSRNKRGETTVATTTTENPPPRNKRGGPRSQKTSTSTSTVAPNKKKTTPSSN